jgi:hypothetical protein
LQEKDFTQIWSKYSHLPVRWINPAQIPQELLKKFPEAQSLKLEAVPIAQTNGEVPMAFREPPLDGLIKQLEEVFGTPIRPCLARPSNIAWARDQAYPRLILPPSQLAGRVEQFRAAAGLNPPAFLELVSTRSPARYSLPELLTNAGVLPEADARRLWADTLGFPPLDIRSFAPHQELYFSIGPSFWWLHRLFPISPISVATAQPVHPRLAGWLAEKIGGKLNFVAELPRKMVLALRSRSLELDPDKVLLDCITAKGSIPQTELPNLEAMRKVIAAPLPNWLRMQKLISDEQLHQLFLEICYLPPAEPWHPEEVQRLCGVLPPGFAEENGCYCLEEQNGALRLGLSQMLSPPALLEIYDRLSGYPLYFQALSYADSVALRNLSAT